MLLWCESTSCLKRGAECRERLGVIKARNQFSCSVIRGIYRQSQLWLRSHCRQTWPKSHFFNIWYPYLFFLWQSEQENPIFFQGHCHIWSWFAIQQSVLLTHTIVSEPGKFFQSGVHDIFWMPESCSLQGALWADSCLHAGQVKITQDEGWPEIDGGWKGKERKKRVFVVSVRSKLYSEIIGSDGGSIKLLRHRMDQPDHVFWVWAETRGPRENPRRYGDNMNTERSQARFWSQH